MLREIGDKVKSVVERETLDSDDRTTWKIVIGVIVIAVIVAGLIGRVA